MFFSPHWKRLPAGDCNTWKKQKRERKKKRDKETARERRTDRRTNDHERHEQRKMKRQKGERNKHRWIQKYIVTDEREWLVNCIESAWSCSIGTHYPSRKQSQCEAEKVSDLSVKTVCSANHFWACCICMGLAFSEASFCRDLVWTLKHTHTYIKIVAKDL